MAMMVPGESRSDSRRRRKERAEELAKELEALYKRLEDVSDQIAKEIHEGAI